MSNVSDSIPNQLIRWMEVPRQPNVYALGNFARQVTFASQQARAYNLIWALFKTNRLAAGQRVAVIGAGLGGLTAVLAALSKDCHVDLFEQASQPCPLQRGNDIRFIHPNILRWPEAGSEAANTNFPYLNWTAANVRGVIKQIDLQWRRRTRKNPRLHQFFNYRVNRLFVSPTKSGPQQPWVTANRMVDSNVAGDESGDISVPGYVELAYDCVILAVGFGEERSLAGVPFQSYWENDSLHQETGRGRRSILVSGCGDGGLIDALRLRLRNFDHAEFVREFLSVAESTELTNQLQQVDRDLRKHATSPDISLRFQAAYNQLNVPSKVEKYFRGEKRTDTAVTLNSPAPGPLSFRASLLNRFATFLAMRFSDLHYLSGRVVAERVETDGYRITFQREDIGKTETQPFDFMIVRHGPENVISKLIPEFAIAELEAWWQKNEDITTQPHWQIEDTGQPHQFFRDYESETVPPAKEVLDLALATFDSAYRDFMRDPEVQSVAVGEHDGKAGFLVTLRPGAGPRGNGFYAGWVLVQYLTSPVPPSSTVPPLQARTDVSTVMRPLLFGIGIYNYDVQDRFVRKITMDARPPRADSQIPQNDSGSNTSGIGTLGCFATDKAGDVYLISASHVLAVDNAGQPGDRIFLEGQSPETGDECVARLTRFAPIIADPGQMNLGIGAAKLEPGVVPDFESLPPPWRVSQLATGTVGNKVAKIGRTSSLTTGYVYASDLTLPVPTTSSESAHFADCILIKADDRPDFSLPGDGGAVIIRDDGAVIGLLTAAFSGSSGQKGGTMATSIKKGLEFLKLDLLVNDEKPTGEPARQKKAKRSKRKSEALPNT